MMENFNTVDIYLGGIFAVSIAFGLMRGMFREILSLLTWIAAILVASFFSGPIAKSFSGSVGSAVSSATGVDPSHSISIVAVVVSFVCLFIITFMVGSFISSLLSRAAEGSGMSLGNRLFGGAFGFGRGFVIVLIVIFLSELTALGKQAAWDQSKIVTAYRPAVKWVDDTISPSLEGIKSSINGAVDKVKDTYQKSGASQLLDR